MLNLENGVALIYQMPLACEHLVQKKCFTALTSCQALLKFLQLFQLRQKYETFADDGRINVRDNGRGEWYTRDHINITIKHMTYLNIPNSQ